MPAKPARTGEEVLLAILKACQAPEVWLTLEELAKLANTRVASVSAQLRNLRKHRFGRHKINKRIRTIDHKKGKPGCRILWEYALARSRQG